MSLRNKQIKYYQDILKENEILLLKSSDTFYKNHYSSSPLATLTGFLGSCGEAVIDKTGKIKIFVDTRYHLLVDKQVFKDIEIYKMELDESFFDAFKKCYKKNTVLYVSDDISLKDYLKYDSYFDLRKYELKKEYSKNKDYNKNAKIFKISDDIDKLSFLEKVEKLKKLSKEANRMLVFNLDEISYLLGLRSYKMEYSSNFPSVLYLDLKNHNHVLFCNEISKKKIDGLSIMSLDEFEDFISTIIDEIYVDIDDINLKNYLLVKNPKTIKKKNLSILASIKSIGAIEDYKKCFERLDLALLNFRKKLKEGLSEYDLSKIFEQELKKTGAHGLSFKTILAIGENSASIHYSNPDKNKILYNENLILLDCGGYFENGFATDITRVFYFGEYPKLIYKKIYTNVLKAFLTCYMSDVTNARKLDLMARTILKPLEQEGFYFNHGLGHGIGTSVHQNPPILNMFSKDIIRPYQIHSIEPGLYGKTRDGVEFGVRIENCCYSDLNFNKISLSKFPFEEVLIDYSLLSEEEIKAVKLWQAQNENY